MAMTQAQKSLVTMLAVIVAAGAVGAFAYWGVYKGDQEKEKSQADEAKIFSFDKSKVKALSLNAKGTLIKIEKSGDNWQIMSPLQVRADKAPVEAIINKLADLKAVNLNAKTNGKLDPAYVVDTDPSKFGLDHPQWSVTLTLDDGKQQVGLDIGMENSFDKSFYFRRSNDKNVYMGEASIKAPLDKTLFDLRDKSIINQDDKDVSELAVATNGSAWSAARDGEGWKLTSPVQEVGDKQTIEAAVHRLDSLRAKAFVADALKPEDAAKFGLDKPAVEAIFTVGPDKTRKTLDIGFVDSGPKDKKAYAHLSSGGPVAEIEPGVVKDLTKNISDLRDRTIVSFDREKVAKVEFDTVGVKLIVDKTKEKAPGATNETDKFTLEGNTAAKIKTWKMSSAIYSLSNFKGADIVEDNATDLAKYGFDKPTHTYVVTGKDGAELARVLIGSLNDKRYYAKGAASNKVFAVEKMTVDGLPAKAEDLIDTGDAQDAKAHPPFLGQPPQIGKIGKKN